MGKTMVGKKIGLDWATGIFKAFQIVFFVFLKLVRPEDTIEHIIIQQMPVLEGLGVTEDRLSAFLETFGYRCLLILDGLDEHVPGKNEDVTKIIRGQKLLSCNIFLTPRPHTAREISKHFHVVVSVSGFTTSEARKFAFKILKDADLVNEVLVFNPFSLTHAGNMKRYHCPILLSFLCLLVREKKITLMDEAMSVGEIYTRMIQCLYKKYTVRKDIEFHISNLIETLTLIGEIAFRALLSSNSLLKRSEVLEKVGRDAFDYGFLIGHEDFRLIRDETADIFVTFAHPSIEQFFGAFYFIIMLSKGKGINNLLKEHMEQPPFMTEPLFLHFCLWFLHETQRYIQIDGKKAILVTLVQLCAERIHSSCLHSPNIARYYPALDFVSAERNNDKLLSAFYAKIFKLLRNVKTVVANSGDPFVWIMKKMPNITHVSVGNGLRYFIFPSSCTIKLFTKGEKYLPDMLARSILERCDEFGRSARLQVFLEGIKGSGLSTEAILALRRSLTHLCVVSYYLGKKELKVLSEAVSRGMLARLRHLSFISYEISEFSLLFKNMWLSLSHLQFDRCFLSEDECSTLAKAISQQNRFPSLESLAIADGKNSQIPVRLRRLFKSPLKCISYLLIDLEKWRNPEVNNFKNAIRKQNMQNLSKLSLSGMREISSINEVLLSLPLKSLSLRRCDAEENRFAKIDKTIAKLELQELEISQSPTLKNKFPVLLSPSLVSLTLRNNGLNSEDLNCLVQANIEGKLPKLKHLDIARNNISGVLQCLFGDNFRWNQLLTLNILDSCQDAPVEVPPDCLTSLQKLSVSDKILNLLILSKKSWTSLRSLQIFANDENILLCLADAHEHGFFPTLQSVCVKMADHKISVLDTAVARKLVTFSVHDTLIDPTDPDLARCVCYNESYHS